jgi:dihydrofolate reductase
MAKVIVGMTMSLDGFINDGKGDLSLLYPDFDSIRGTEVLQETIRTTGAVVMGRRAYEMAGGDFTGYEFQNPIFVLTHHPPEQAAKGENENLRFHFVTDGIESAVTQAKKAAGEKNVTVIGGAQTVQQMIDHGLFDELEIDIAPVLLGDGQRLFENLTTAPVELEQVGVIEYRGVTQIRLRAKR